MKKLSIVLVFLFSGLAMAQSTTVVLEDQCNCEVLSGPDVTAAGMISPAGADTGDIYVNTNTGAIYYWDGDTWELTSSDDQKLQNFSFDGGTNQLKLVLENGGSVTVDLSVLNNTGTTTINDRIEVIGTDLVITDSDTRAVSIPLADIVDGVDTNTTITSLEIDATDTNIVLTDSETNAFSIALADIVALVNTDNQTLSEVLTEGADANGTVITGLGTPVAGTDAVTKAYVDGLADDDITTATLDGSSLLTINEGTTSVDVSLAALEESADIAANATDISTNATNIATHIANDDDTDDQNEIQDLSIIGNVLSLTGDATTVTLPTPDGTETLVEAAVGSELSVTGDGSSATPYVIDNLRPNIFYPPSIAIDVSAYSGTTITNETIDLYAQYQAQYGSPMVSSVGPGPGNTAPAAIPTYTSSELYYYVTLFDTSVFANVSIDENGEMTFDIIGAPADYNSLINVVFVVK